MLTLSLIIDKYDRQLANLPVATGAVFNFYYQQHKPQYIPDTRVDLLRQIQE
jgi:hypothetical protein